MKKNLMKKVFAVTLSVAMACSMIPATNPVTASAAASVKLKTTRKTLEVGQKFKLTLKNNTKKWKVTKATSANSKVAKVYVTKPKYIKVKGKSEGKAVVKVRVKSAQTKKVKNLKCTFTVEDNSTPTPTPTPTPNPTPDPTPVQTDATVKTQEELDTALANSNITKITVATEEEASFVIKEGTYDTVDLIVNAPKADVENNAKFRNISIQAIKGETWTEKAKGNIIKVLAKLARIIVDKDAVVASMDFTTADADIKLEVNGELTTVGVSAKIKLDIKGESKKSIKVNVTSNAKDTEVTSAVPVDVETSANMKLNLKEGAEKSTLAFKAADLNVELDNKTKEAVAVTKFDNTKSQVGANQTATVTSPSNGGSTTTPVVPGYNGGSSSSINKVNSTEVVSVSGASIQAGALIKVTSGSATVISQGSLTFTVAGITNTSGSAMECAVNIKSESGKYSRFENYKACNSEGTNYGAITFTVPIYNVLPNEDLEIEISVRAKETITTLAGKAVTGKFYIGLGTFSTPVDGETHIYRTYGSIPRTKFGRAFLSEFKDDQWIIK